MTRIILIGYMGAGKTTIGKALSKELGIIFYDLDWYIESRMRKSVSQIFAERGEEGFRKIEYNMLHEVAEFENVIISCGGGTPCFFDNMDYLNQQGQVVYLKADPEVLYKHLLMAKVERPLLKARRPTSSSLSSASSWKSVSPSTAKPVTPSMSTCWTTTRKSRSASIKSANC